MRTRQNVTVWNMVEKCEVRKRALVLKAWKYGADFAIHRALGGNGWVVTDLYSSARVSSWSCEKTALAAFKRAKATLERFGQDAYIKAREARRRERFDQQRKAWDETPHTTPITVDMILDMAKIAVLTTADFK